MQSLAMIKSKIYDSITDLYPQVMAIKDGIIVPGGRRKGGDVEKIKADSISNENKIKIQLGFSKVDHAERLESQAFDFLFDKDVESALGKFGECQKIHPTYKSVKEIVDLLKSERQNLSDKNSAKWNTVYKTILEKYSWKLRPDVIAGLTQKSH